MKTYKLIIGLIVALLITGCNLLASSGGQAETLEGTEWLLVSYRGLGAVSDVETTALFESGQISGNAGCNQYGGQYDLAKGGSDRIEIANLASTLMFCNEPAGVMDQEQDFFEIMNDAYRLEISGGRLMIFNEAGEVLAFTANQ